MQWSDALIYYRNLEKNIQYVKNQTSLLSQSNEEYNLLISSLNQLLYLIQNQIAQIQHEYRNQ
ncbi:hypothetical protein [Floccifex sp.]|uniref:hypothetical protein n=1 Tax=Floccifex sp. TaxID=2815810 RepID=UPI002A75BE1F|nr:hypothetical protein [Floccifex sp.]MDD7280861.1 hypothetical protein [Erysipelotrichaceae bacterium]MDY2958325.1 hypothetical protein [Floccifex sp.]